MEMESEDVSEDLDLLDFSSICRICCGNDAKLSVFSVHIYKKIMSCASVQVWRNDGMPSKICDGCVAKLLVAYQFKKQCERNDIFLRDCRAKGKYIDSEGNPTDDSKNAENVSVDYYPADVDGDCVMSSIENKNGKYELIQNLDSKTKTVNSDSLYLNDNLISTISAIDGSVHISNLYSLHSVAAEFSNLYDLQNNKHELTFVAADPKEYVDIGAGVNLTFNNEELIEKQTEETQILTNSIVKYIETHKCNICGKEFISNWKLTRHMKTHSLEAPYKCKICKKGFTTNGNVKVHMRTHNDERPFACQYCEKTCRQQQDLDKHMRTHTGERPHVCSICTKGFTTSSNLIAHERIHTGEKPYVCSICRKGFCQSNELTKHVRTHTGEKSHICPICNKGFNGSSTLIVHLRIHTGERPYVCSICKKGFTQSSCLLAHVRRHSTLEDLKKASNPESLELDELKNSLL